MASTFALTERYAQSRRLYRVLIAVFFGALAALGQAPLSLWPVTLVSMAVLYGLWRQTDGAWRAFRLGLAGGVGYFSISLSWIVEPFLVDPLRHGWLAPFALMGVSFGFGLFWAASFGLVKRLNAGALGWIGAFMLFEVVRGTLMTGFPWAQIGHVLISTPLLLWASFAGELGLIALVLGGAVSFWAVVSDARAAGALGLFCFAALYGAGAALTPPPSKATDGAIARVIQPNAAQHEKWDPDKIQQFFDRQIAFTAEPGADRRPDVVLWPETSVPVWLNHADETLDAIADAAQGSAMVLGLRRFDGPRIYNSLLYLDETGAQAGLYDKHHLVPFGEFMPMGDFFARFGIQGFATGSGSGFSAGPGTRVMDMGKAGKALPLICYEGVFARNLLAAPERPDVLMMITNDAWFGKVSGPYQHLAMARLRSVEQGLPMIRSANTGVSAVIDAGGHVLAQIPLGQAGWIDAPIPPPNASTFYATYGDSPWLGLTGMLMLFGLGFQQLRSRSVKD